MAKHRNPATTCDGCGRDTHSPTGFCPTCRLRLWAGNDDDLAERDHDYLTLLGEEYTRDDEVADETRDAIQEKLS